MPARQVIRNVLAAEGVAGFYRGFLPNAAKNLPNKGALLIMGLELGLLNPIRGPVMSPVYTCRGM